MKSQMPEQLETPVKEALTLLSLRNGPLRDIDTAFAAIHAKSPVLVRRIEIAFDAGMGRIPAMSNNLTSEDHEKLRGIMRAFAKWAYAEESE